MHISGAKMLPLENATRPAAAGSAGTLMGNGRAGASKRCVATELLPAAVPDSDTAP